MRLLVTATACAGTIGGYRVSARLELVAERLELRHVFAAAMRESLREQPVGKPRVAGQQRPMEICPDRPSHSSAFEAALAVVPEAGQDAAQWLGAGIEPGPAGVVLEARQCVPGTGVELALEEDVADHSALAGHGLERQQ